jgi:PAS domain-containing protein
LCRHGEWVCSPRHSPYGSVSAEEDPQTGEALLGDDLMDMDDNGAFAQLRAVQGRVASFGEQVAANDRPAVEILPEALLELGSALEELRVCEEELSAQAGHLASSRERAEADSLRYQELFDAAPLAFLATNSSGLIREANRAAVTLLQVPRARLTGKPLLAYVTQEHRRAFRTAMVQLPDVPWAASWRFGLQPRHRPPVTVTADVNVTGGLEWPAREVHWLIREVPGTPVPGPGKHPDAGEPDGIRQLRAAIGQLHAEIGQLQHALDVRVRIEQAKGMLMERKGVGETAAYEVLRGLARSSRRRVDDIAKDILDGELWP